MNTTYLFAIIVFIIVLDYAVERFLDYLNARNRNAPIPDVLSDIYDTDTYEKQQRYGQAKSTIALWSSTISIVFTLLMLFFDGFAYLNTWIVDTFNAGMIVSGLLFFGILMLISEIISLPLEWYDTFVIEEKFGFNKMTPGLFVMDTIKSLLLTVVFGGALLAGLLWLISYFGEQFWLIAWAAASVVVVFINMFYSSLIVPLFNKQTPLEDGPLKEAIFAFSTKAGFALDNIYVIDGSKRSTKANAYFSGFGPKKRIVLFDTLIKELSTEEIVAVLAHEIGHYKKKHTLVMLGVSLAQLGLLFYLFGLFVSQPIFTEVLNIPYSEDTLYISLYVFSILFTPVSFFISIAVNVLSRKNEYQADAFSGENSNPQALETALKRLSKNSLSNLTPHPWYVFCYYSHPTLYQRILALRAIKK